MGWILQVFFFFFYKCQKTLKWQSKFRKDIQKDASDANTSRSKVIWITGTEKANGKVTNFFFFNVLVKFCPQCIHWSQWMLRHAYTSKGKFCLSAVQTPIIS